LFWFFKRKRSEWKNSKFQLLSKPQRKSIIFIHQIIGDESMVMVVKEVIWFQTFETHGCISKTYYLRLVVMKPTNHNDNHGGFVLASCGHPTLHHLLISTINECGSLNFEMGQARVDGYWGSIRDMYCFNHLWTLPNLSQNLHQKVLTPFVVVDQTWKF
jgi:hypothetical protein